LSLVEAFACGVPVVAARLGAAQEIVSDGKTGLHFDAGDPDDLAQKVQWACSHPEEMDAMSRAARAQFGAEFTAERNYEKLLQIYEAVAAAKGVVRSLGELPAKVQGRPPDRTLARGV